MVDEKVRLIMGSLLHDTGKVIYRQGDDRRNHSISGYDYLKEETNLTDSEILDCVRYHHASLLKRAVGLKENSLAYIVYLADNIAAFSDRRKKDESEDRGFERSLAFPGAAASEAVPGAVLPAGVSPVLFRSAGAPPAFRTSAGAAFADVLPAGAVPPVSVPVPCRRLFEPFFEPR